MRQLFVYTEEESIKKVLDIILPKLLPEDVAFRVLPHQGKQDLESGLRKTVPTISRIPGVKILVTRDQDSADCKEVKSNLVQLMTSCNCEFGVRIICRELESWFLGDLPAVEAGYPRFKSSQYKGKAELRNVDSISSPNRFLRSILPEYADRENLPKLEVAETIAPHLNLSANTSYSFIQTCEMVKKLMPPN